MRQSFRSFGGVLNHDFCPWANGYVYWLKQPIGWFVLAAVAALVIGVSVAPHALVILAAISVVIVLGVAWPWIGVRGISCVLSFDRKRASEGSSLLVRIAVINRWPWPLWGLTVERGFFLSRADSAEQFPAACLARIPAWSRTTFTWDFEPQRRGRYPTEAPRIASGFPFGIWQGHRQITVENELLVWPSMASLRSVPPIHGRTLAVGGTPNRHVGHEGDMSGLRSFRNGDSLRHVHWAQTAKHDRLIVRERQTTGRRRVQLILDGHKEAHPDCDGTNSLEELIRVGASIGRQFHAHNANVDVRLGRQTIVVTPGSQGLNRLLDALAIWLPLDDPEAKSIPGVGADDHSLLVVVTTDRGARRWISQLPRNRGAQLVILRFGTQDDAHEVRQIDEQCRQRAHGQWEARPSWLELDGHDDVLARLVRGWERICHDGWSDC
jgi:uncharacterized protein (DUF58 family)